MFIGVETRTIANYFRLKTKGYLKINSRCSLLFANVLFVTRVNHQDDDDVSVSVRVQKEGACLHFDLEAWTLLIANGHHTKKYGRLGRLLYGHKIGHFAVNGNSG